MKYIKQYEEIIDLNNNDYTVEFTDDDYAIFYYDKMARYAYHVELTDKLKEFLNTNVGKINIVSKPQLEWLDVIYENVPDDLVYKFGNNNSILLTKDAVIAVSTDKEELEARLSANKYNL